MVETIVQEPGRAHLLEVITKCCLMQSMLRILNWLAMFEPVVWHVA